MRAVDLPKCFMGKLSFEFDGCALPAVSLAAFGRRLVGFGASLVCSALPQSVADWGSVPIGVRSGRGEVAVTLSRPFRNRSLGVGLPFSRLTPKACFATWGIERCQQLNYRWSLRCGLSGGSIDDTVRVRRLRLSKAQGLRGEPEEPDH